MLFQRAVEYIRGAFTRIKSRPAVYLPAVALLLTCVIESLSRHSPLGGAAFLLADPLMFLYNALIIMFTLSLSLLFPKRGFMLFLISVLWLLLGVANCLLLFFATIPLGFTDIMLAGSVLRIIDVYLSPLEIALVCLGLAAATAGVLAVWKRCPKRRVRIWRGSLTLCALAAVLSLLSLSTSGAKAISESFGDLVTAYDDLGFAYCFSTSVVDRGVSRPEGYCAELVDSVMSALPEESAGGEPAPNIIFLQLESFFDPSLYSGVELSENPVPVFTALKSAYPHGYLTVPAVGTGTANTEFEVLTGMSLDYFGTGEYPYKTVLGDRTCESLCYALSRLGLSATAIHNNTRTFYGRGEVFANLGFDRFVSVEDMENVAYNPTGWANDDVLTSEITGALDATEGRDLIYTITVQAHGSYSDAEFTDADIEAECPENEGLTDSWEYYAEQLSGTDAFIGALIRALTQRGEPAVVVMYGDHLPSLGLEAEKLETGSLFQTEYVIWSNIGLKYSCRGLYAYQLGAYVQERLGICEGAMAALHQKYGYDAENAEYQDAMQLLEYDMLYGDGYVWGGESPWQPMKLGH